MASSIQRIDSPVSLFPPESQPKKRLCKVVFLVTCFTLALLAFTAGALALGFCVHRLCLLSLLILPILALVAKEALSPAVYEVYVALGVLPSLKEKFS